MGSISWVPCSFPMLNPSHISSIQSSFYLLPLLRPIAYSLILLSASTSSSTSREQGNKSQLTNSSMHNLQQGQRLRPLCKLPNTGENISRPMHSSNQQHSSQNSAPEDGRNGIVEDQVSGFERGGFAFGRRAGGLLGSVGHDWRCGIGVRVVFWRQREGKATPLRVWEPREIWIWILGKELLGDRRFDSRELRGHPGLTSFSHSKTLSQNILVSKDHRAIEVLFV